MNILINSKELYSNFDNKKIIKELINYYNKNGNKNILNDKKIKYDIKKINEPFKPNETTINSLYFIDNSNFYINFFLNFHLIIFYVLPGYLLQINLILK